MKNIIERFLTYLGQELGYSLNTVKAYRHDLKKFKEFILSQNKNSINQVKEQDIRNFLLDLVEANSKHRGNSKVSRARKQATLRSFFNFLTERKIINHNPMLNVKNLKLDSREADFLTEKEYKQVLKIIREQKRPLWIRDFAIFTTFLGTGIRLSELINLKLHNANLEKGSIKIFRKRGKEQYLPLNKDVIKAIKDYLKVRPNVKEKALFLSKRGKKFHPSTVWYLVKKYLALAGIQKDKTSPHTLRHSFGVALVSKSIPLVSIQKLMGHKRLETTARYLHISDENLRYAVSKLSLSI